MDRVSELYDTAEKSGIEVLSFPLPETGSLSIEQGGRCYIGIDSSRKLTQAEEGARSPYPHPQYQRGGRPPWARAGPLSIRRVLHTRHALRSHGTA
jgi:hypothetical protein